MAKEKSEGIKLRGEDIQKLHVSEWDFDDNEQPKNHSQKVKGFEGWYVTSDYHSGKYDSSKSSMINFEIYLYDDKGEFRGMAIGGYYNEGCGVQFSYDLTFEPPTPITKATEFDLFLIQLGEDEGSLKSKIAKLKKQIEKLEA
jgi:hypothetical protein